MSKSMRRFCHPKVGVNSTLYDEGFVAQVTQRFASRTLD